MIVTNSDGWATDVFGQAKLGDPRRTVRLVKLASGLAQNAGKSLVKSSVTPADMEAAYRFIRNSSISSEDIAEAGFLSTAAKVRNDDTLLALEDTTSLNFSHKSVRDELGHITNGKRARGFQVHSVLLFSPKKSDIIGLIEQRCWSRDLDTFGKKYHHLKIPYEQKESFKWQTASMQMGTRLGEKIKHVISVCDREADIIEYLDYKQQHDERFIVRCAHSRCIEEGEDTLFAFGEALRCAGKRTIHVPQKGGRKARTVICEIKFAPVTIKIPVNKRGESIPLYYVNCIGSGKNDKSLTWHLLTSEPVKTKAQAEQIITYYEKRWLIEDYHKSWKSGGTQVEDLRMQSRENLERMITVLAFVAVRIQQLRYIGVQRELAEKTSCEVVFQPLEWKLLWQVREQKRIPRRPPSLYWAYIHLAKLAGWQDSKRNGRAGWVTLWEGWFKLQNIIEGYQLAKSLDHDL